MRFDNIISKITRLFRLLMMKAIILSKQIKFAPTGKVIHEILPHEIVSMKERSIIRRKHPVKYDFENNILRKWEEEVQSYEYDDFESTWQSRRELLYITKENDWDNLLKEEVENLQNPKYLPDLEKIPCFSATSFQAGRAQLMQHQILKTIIRHANKHFNPQLLIKLTTQEYNFSTDFKPEKMEPHKIKEEMEIKWIPETWNGHDMHRPLIRTADNIKWRPAFFDTLRKKTVLHQEEFDKNILEMLKKKSICVIGEVGSKAVEDFAWLISNIHIVEENRFDPIIKKNKLRLRICIDAFVLNDATKLIPFKLITGQEVTLAIDTTKQFLSFDNKSSFYSTRLGPACTPLLCFRWRGLILAFLVAPFGITNAPAMNESLMNLLHLEIKHWTKVAHVREHCQATISWIDDLLLFSTVTEKEGADTARITKLLALIYMKTGLTLNVQKSQIKPTKRISYLGITLDAEKKVFAIQQKLVQDLQCFMIDNLKIEDDKDRNTILHNDFIKKGWKHLELQSPTKWMNYKISFKTIERLIGKLTWCNRNYTLDIEIFAIAMLYRYKPAWVSKKIIHIAMKQLYDTPKMLTQYLTRDQPIKPYTMSYFTRMTSLYDNESAKLENWQGLEHINLTGILSEKGKNGPWIRNIEKLNKILQENSETCYKNFKIDGNFQKGQLIWEIWIQDSLDFFFATWKEQYEKYFIGLQKIKTKIQEKWSIAIQIKFTRKHPREPNPNYTIWPTKELENLGRFLYDQNEIQMNAHFEIFMGWKFWVDKNKDTLFIINYDNPRLIPKISNVLAVKPEEVAAIWIFQTKKILRIAQAVNLKLDPLVLILNKSKWLIENPKKNLNNPKTKFIYALGFNIRLQNDAIRSITID